MFFDGENSSSEREQAEETEHPKEKGNQGKNEPEDKPKGSNLAALDIFRIGADEVGLLISANLLALAHFLIHSYKRV